MTTAEPLWGEYAGTTETCPVCHPELPNPDHFFCCDHPGCEECGRPDPCPDHGPGLRVVSTND